MNFQSRLTRVFERAPVIPFDDTSKIVFMSDCHRGNGSWADDFAKNEMICYAALNHYYRDKFTYFELGDGDELWKFKSLSEVLSVNARVCRLLADFYKEGRLYSLYGNHDLVKKCGKGQLNSYYDESRKKELPLFPGIQVRESFVLEHMRLKYRLCLVHGHQGDLINDGLWKLGRFLVRYLWTPLELVGINNPFATSVSGKKKAKTEERLRNWASENHQILICGHTHRAEFPDIKEPGYFNDGCCVHSRSITALEVVHGAIALVRWSELTREDGSLYIGREVVHGPVKLSEYGRKN